MVLVPINHGNAHWTAAAINFKKKRIESYDSMHSSRPKVLKELRNYVELEHKDKRKKPFDWTGWEDYEPSVSINSINPYEIWLQVRVI